MPDDKTPGSGPANPPANNGGQDAQQSNQQVDWQKKLAEAEERLKGLNRVLNDRDAKLKEREEELKKLNERLANLESQLQSKEAEFGAKAQGWEENIKKVTQDKAALEEQLRSATARLTLFETLQEYPHLMPMAHLITPVDNKEAQREIVQNFDKATRAITDQAIEQVKRGVLPQPPATGNPKHNYGTQEGWSKALRQAAGTPEFEEVSKAYKEWISRQQ